MDKVYKRKLEKIFNRVGKIASKGKDNVQEYFNLIDEMIEGGNYGAFIEVLDIFYDIDVIGEIDVNIVKTNTWKEILFQTKTPFLQKLSLLYKQREVYQQYNEIFLDKPLLFPQISNKYSATFSYTSLTASIDFDRINDNFVMTVLDDSIDYIQIDRANWINSVPTDERLVDEYVISYSSVSNTHLNISSISTGSFITFSTDTDKNFMNSQIVKANRFSYQPGSTFSRYEEIIGEINSYDINTGQLVLSVDSFTWSGPNYQKGLWNINYLSGPKNPKFVTNIPVTHGGDYKISTIENNGKKWYYKLNLDSESFLGTIDELDTFNQGIEYLVQNKEFAKILGQRKVYLVVKRIGTTQSYGITYENPAFSPDQNLLRRYKLAVNYLVTGSTASN